MSVTMPSRLQHAVQRVVRAEPGAAPGQILGAALVHVGVPADRTQQMRGKQPARANPQ